MAVYLGCHRAPRGRGCQLGSQSSPLMRAGANGAAGEADESTAALAASGLGYLNLPTAHSPGLGDSGKCSPSAALASAGPRCGPWTNPCNFTRFPLSSADPHEPGLPAPWSRGRGSGARSKARLGTRRSERRHRQHHLGSAGARPSTSPL